VTFDLQMSKSDTSQNKDNRSLTPLHLDRNRKLNVCVCLL